MTDSWSEVITDAIGSIFRITEPQHIRQSAIGPPIRKWSRVTTTNKTTSEIRSRSREKEGQRERGRGTENPGHVKSITTITFVSFSEESLRIPGTKEKKWDDIFIPISSGSGRTTKDQLLAKIRPESLSHPLKRTNDNRRELGQQRQWGRRESNRVNDA